MADPAEDRGLEPSEADESAEDSTDIALAIDAADTESLVQRLPRDLPILPVRGVVVFPGTVVPLTIGREKSKLVIDAVLAGNKLLGIFAQRREDTVDPKLDDIYRVGTAAAVLKLLRMPDGTNSLLVHGLVRVGIEHMQTTDPYWMAVVNPHEDSDSTQSNLELEALVYTARQTAQQVMALSPNIPEEATVILNNIEKPGPLADFLAANLSLGLVQKQELLETFDIADRLRKITATLNNQLEILKLSQKIQTDVRKEIDKTQREYYLQEQLKAIKKELGDSENDSLAADLAEVRRRIEAASMPDAVRSEADRELGRLQRISQASPEHGVIRDYLDWLVEMPWTQQTEDQLDLKLAEQILNEDHYGLTKVKRRILEYLSVRKLKKDGKGPILCFVGPPGVGKTSLGQSIARALGRKFCRLALGGVRDEADIRGHRRTYIGAVPGRIVQEIRKAHVRNPLLMLDELDKLGRDFRGDPSAALLEVLDPQQNHSFTDHYLAVPFDLSRVLFITTANWLDPVDAPLRDRMEVIEISGYTVEEKVEISRRYLLPRQALENGLTLEQVQISPELLEFIIDGYTREAGVRTLERKLGAICRGFAARIARGEKVAPGVSAATVHEILGPRQFDRETKMIAGLAGVATGLAYTPVGGQIMFIEATAMPGRGSFQLTGQIGDVMRESAQTALSLMRANARKWKLDLTKLRETDIHIHVPAGAVPKDGPSAGVAMVTTLVSLFAKRPVSPDVGMTGEITLRGLVLPIGGLKEKVLAAHNAGLRTVILPRRNEPDLEELPTHIRGAMKFVLAERIEEVLSAAIPDSASGRRSGTGGSVPRGSRARNPRSGNQARAMDRRQLAARPTPDAKPTPRPRRGREQ